ncbi:MAG: hypothetical protein IK075_02715, partial [Prevotella sp.]|nr:hypothetical protein [Prevotella sp.]
MKYLVRYILPIAVIGFLACSGEEVIDNPDYDPIKNTVKAELAISIGHAGDKAKTRMADDITQSDGGFRGIEKYFIFAADETQDNYQWGYVARGGDLMPTVNDNPAVKVFKYMEISVGVDHFLFYGFADGAADDDASIDVKMQRGYTKAFLPGPVASAENFEFRAVQIAPNYEDDDEWKTPVNSIEEYLTSIVRSDGWSGATNLNLIEFYQTFAKPDHLYAGSAQKVLATVQELYKAVYEVANAPATIDTQKDIANAIIGNITSSTYVTTSGSGADLVLDWETTFKDDYEKFPENLGLPQGAAQYEFKNIGTEGAPNWRYVYNTENTVNAEATDVKDYIYPCELYYLTHTPLRAFAGDIDWPETPEDWSYESWTGGGKSITSSTHSVALVNNVQYGTAQLATYVKCSPATLNS